MASTASSRLIMSRVNKKLANLGKSQFLFFVPIFRDKNLKNR